LALLLVGILRFGMGLINLQGQVQDIVIGGLLILSILVPRLAGQFSTRLGWSQATLLRASVGVVVAVLFALFFFWSRGIVLAQQ
jgi:uncharacterized protein YqgC (DUF456 family)